MCTNERNGHACSVAAWATSSALSVIDGDDGIDNATGATFAAFVRGGTPPATWGANWRANTGEYSNMLRIAGYNGLANDSQVKVAMAGVIFAPPPGAKDPRPTWQGTDEWRGVDRNRSMMRRQR